MAAVKLGAHTNLHTLQYLGQGLACRAPGRHAARPNQAQTDITPAVGKGGQGWPPGAG